MKTSVKREKVEACEICASKFSTFKAQHQCKRCLRAVCSDCSKDKAVVLKIQHVDKEKHRNCNICKTETINQKKLRDEQQLKFCQDSVMAKKWLKQLSNFSDKDLLAVYQKALQNPDSEEIKKTVALDMREFNNYYENQRQGLNYSIYDQGYYITERIDKKEVQEAVRRVINAFLNMNPKIGFAKGMIDFCFQLLCYCSEHACFFLFNTVYSQVLPEYLYPRSYKSQAHTIDEDIKFIEDILQTNYKTNPTELNSIRNVLQEAYIDMAHSFASNCLSWESYGVVLDTILTDQSFYPLQNSIALMCHLSSKQISQGFVNDVNNLIGYFLKNTNPIRVREFLQQQQNDRMKTVSMQRSMRFSRVETPEDRIKILEQENQKLKQSLKQLQKSDSIVQSKRSLLIDDDDDFRDQMTGSGSSVDAQAKLEQTMRDFMVLQKLCDELKSKNEDLEAELDQQKSRNKNMMEEISDRDDEIQTLKEKVKSGSDGQVSNNTQHKTLEDENNELKKQLDILRAELTGVESKVLVETQKNSQQLEELQSLRENLKQANQQIETERKQHTEELSAKMMEQETLRKTLESQSGESGKQTIQLQEQNKKFEYDLKQMQQEVDDMRHQNIKLQNLSANQKHELEQKLSHEQKIHKQHQDEAAAKILTLNETIKQLQAENTGHSATLNEQVAQAKLENQQRVTELEESKKAAEILLEAKVAETLILQSEREKQKHRIDELTRQVQDLEQDKIRLTASSDGTTKELEQLLQKERESNSQLQDQIKAQMIEHQSQIKQLEEGLKLVNLEKAKHQEEAAEKISSLLTIQKELQQKMEAEENDKLVLIKEKDNLNQQLSSLTQQMMNSQFEITQLNSELLKESSEFEAFKSEAAEQQEALKAELIKKIQNLEDDQKKLISSQIDLEEQNSQSKLAHQKKENELMDEISALEQSKKATQQLLEAKIAEYLIMKSDSEKYQHRIDELTKKNQDLEQDKIRLTASSDGVTKELEQLLQKERENLANMQQEKSQLQAQLEGQVNQKQQLEKDYENLKQQLASQSQQIMNNQFEITQLNSELLKESTQFEAFKKEAAEQLEQLKVELTKKVDSLEILLVESDKAKKELHEQLQNEQTRLQQSNNKVSELELEIKNLQTLEAEIKNQLEQQTIIRDQQTLQIKEFEQQNSKLMSENSEKLRVLEHLQDSLDQQSKQIQDLNYKLQENQIEKEKFCQEQNLQISQHKADQLKLTAEIQNLQQETKQLSIDKEKMASEVISQKQKLQDLEEDKQRLMVSSNDSSKELENQLSREREKSTQLSQNIDQLESQLKQLLDERNALNQNLRDQKTLYDQQNEDARLAQAEFQEKYQQSQANLGVSQQALVVQKEAYDEANMKIKDLERQKNENEEKIQQIQANLIKLTQAHETMQQESQLQIKNHQEHIANLNSDILTLKSQSQSQKSEGENHIYNLQQKVKALEDDKVRLMATSDGATKELENQLQKERETSNQVLNEAKVKILDLESYKQSIDQQYQQLQEKQDKLEQENQQLKESSTATIMALEIVKNQQEEKIIRYEKELQEFQQSQTVFQQKQMADKTELDEKSAQLLEITTRLNSLKLLHEDLEQMLKDKEAQIQILNNTNTEKEVQLAKVSKQVQDLEEDILRITTSSDLTKKEQENLLLQEKEALRQSTNLNYDLQREIKEKEEQIEALKQKFESVELVNQTIIDQKSQLEQLLAVETNTLEVKNIELSQKLETSNNQIIKLEEEKNHLQGSILKIQEDAQNEKTAISRQISELENLKAQLVVEIEQRDNQIKLLNESKINLEALNLQLSQDIHQNKEENQLALDICGKKIATIEEEKSKSYLEQQKLQEDLNNIQRSKEEQKEQYKKQIETLEGQNLVLQRSSQEYEIQINNNQKLIEQKINDHKQLEVKVQQLIEDSTQQSANHQNQIKELESLLIKERESLALIQVEKSTLSLDLNQSISNLQTQNQSLNNQLMTLQQQLQSLNKELSQKTTAFEEHKIALTTELTQKEIECRNLGKENDRKENQLQLLNKQLKDQEEDFSRQNFVHLENISTLNNQLSREKQISASQQEASMIQIQTLEEKVKSAQIEVQKKNEQLKRSLEDHQQVKDELGQKVIELQTTIEDLQQQFSAKNKEINQLKRDVENHGIEYQVLSKKHHDLEEDRLRVVTQLEVTSKEFEQQLIGLKEANQLLKVDSMKQNTDLNDKISSKQQEIQHLEEKLKEQQTNIEHFRHQSENQIKSLESQIKLLEKQVSEIESDASILRKEKDENEQKNINLKKQVQDLEEDKSRLTLSQDGQTKSLEDQLKKEREAIAIIQLESAKQVTQLNEQISSLIKQNNNQNEELKRNQESFEQYRSETNLQLINLEESKIALATTIANVEQQLTNLKRENEAKQIQQEQLQNKYTDLEDEKKRLQTVMEASIKNLEIQLQKEREAQVQLQLEFTKKQADLNDLIQILEHEKQDHQKEINLVRQELSKSASENQSQIQKLQLVNADLLEKSLENQDLIDRIQIEIQQKDKEILSQNKKIVEIEEDKNRLMASSDGATKTLEKQLQKEREALIKFQEESREQIEDLKAQLNIIESERQKVLERTESLNEQLTKSQNDLQHQLEIFELTNTENSKNKEVISDLTQQNELKLVEIQTLNKKIQDLEDDKQRLMTSYDGTIKQLEAKLIKERDASLLVQTENIKQINELKGHNGQLEKINTQLDRDLTNARTDHQTLSEQLNQSQESLNSLRNDFAVESQKKDLENEKLRKEIEQHQAAIQLTNQTIKSLEEDKVRLLNTSDGATKNMEDLLNAERQNFAELQAKSNQQITLLDQQLSLLRKDLEAQKHNFSLQKEEIDQSTIKNIALEATILALTQEKLTKEKQVEEFTIKAQAYEQKLTELNDKLQTLELTSQSHEKQYQDIIEEQKQKILQIENDVHFLKEENEIKQKLVQEHMDIINENAQTIAKFNEANSQLVQEEQQQIQHELQENLMKIQKLEQLIVEQKALIQEQKDQLQSVSTEKDDHESQVKDLTSKILNLQHQQHQGSNGSSEMIIIKQLEDENHNLIAKLESIQNNLDQSAQKQAQQVERFSNIVSQLYRAELEQEQIILHEDHHENSDDIKKFLNIVQDMKNQDQQIIKSLQERITFLEEQISVQVNNNVSTEDLKIQLKQQKEINHVLIDRMTRMNMDVVEQIQFVRKYKPSPDEAKQIDELIQKVDPNAGPLLGSVHYILVKKNLINKDNLRFDASQRKSTLDLTKPTAIEKETGSKQSCNIF